MALRELWRVVLIRVGSAEQGGEAGAVEEREFGQVDVYGLAGLTEHVAELVDGAEVEVRPVRRRCTCRGATRPGSRAERVRPRSPPEGRPGTTVPRRVSLDTC